MHKIDAEEDCVLLDDRMVRSNAMLTTLILFLALITSRPVSIVILFIQTVVFILGIFAPSRNLYSKISKKFSLIRLFKQGHGEHPRPVRFSQQVGLLFVLPAFSLMAFNYRPASSVLLLACLIASSLNAFAGICIACRLYPRLAILRHKIQHLFA